VVLAPWEEAVGAPGGGGGVAGRPAGFGTPLAGAPPRHPTPTPRREPVTSAGTRGLSPASTAAPPGRAGGPAQATATTRSVAASGSASAAGAGGGPDAEVGGGGPVERQPLSHLRRTIAERMTLSATLIPHVTHFDRADITELDAIIRRNVEPARERGLTLTLTSFLLKAAALALQEHPQFNASLDP